MIFGSFWNESGNLRTESRNLLGNVYFIVNLTNCRRFQWLKLSRTSINDILVDEGTDFVQNTVDDVCMSYKWQQSLSLVLQRKPFAFELCFCLPNAWFFIVSSKTRSIVPTSNLCRNVQRPTNQFNQKFKAKCFSHLEKTDKITSIYTTQQCWHIPV